MKTIYAFLAFICFSGALSAQSVQDLNVTIINDLNSSTGATTETTTCSNDTVQYPLAKATGLSALSINNATSAQAAGQYYNAPQPITISGLEFYAYKIDATGGTVINVTVEVYLAGLDSLPTGAPLTSAIVPVDTSFGGGGLSVLQKTASFTPITVSAPYIVVVKNLSPNGIGVIFNSYTVGDGLTEWLCDIDLFGTWTRPYDVNVGGSIMDADLVAHPVVSYDLTSDFTVGNQCFSGGTTATFTNASSPILEDRMYNQAAFLGITELSYTYDFGDGSATVNAIDTFNVYTGATSSNLFTATLTDTIYGWTSTCSDSHTEFVGDSLTNNWTYNQVGANVSFTDQSFAGSGVVSWLWDFGDGNTSTMQNPTHTYATTGTYTVCLTTSSNCGADSTCQSVTYVGCGNPSADFTFTSSAGTVDFTNTSSTTGGTTYAWDFGDGNSATTLDASNTYTTNGSYTVTLLATDSCGVDSVSQVVVICLAPVASFTVSGTEPTFDVVNTSITFGTVTYEFDMGDGTNYSTPTASHTYSANGTYIITLTVADSCGTTSTTQTVTVSTIGLNELKDNRISVYPNPSIGQFQVMADINISEIAVYDVNGRLVYSESNDLNTKALINTADWSYGQYTVQVVLADGLTIHKKLVVAK